MEEQPSSMFELQIDEFAQNSLRETTKWTRFIAIIFYVLIGFMALGLLSMFMFKDVITQAFSQVPQFSQFGTGTGIMMTAIGVMVVIVIGISIVITYTLMRFSTQTKKGIDQQNQEALESGIGSLKTYMVISGVLGIIGLCFGLLQFLILL